MSARPSLARLPEAPARAADMHDAGHAHDHGAHPHDHKHDHSHPHAHGDHHHGAHALTSASARDAYLPAFSLFALSAFQRFLMALPVVALLWLAALWAMGAAG